MKHKIQKIIGHALDHAGLYFARRDFERIAAILSRWAENVDPNRLDARLRESW